MRRHEQVAPRTEHAPELVAPCELELVGEMREDGQGIHEVEAFVLERDGRLEAVELEAGERKVRATPLDCFRIDVSAADASSESGPVTRHAAAAAAEVENRVDLCARDVCSDRVVGRAAAAKEPVGVCCAGDAHHQPPRRQRGAVDRCGTAGTERDEPLVAMERRADEAGAREQAEESSLHGERTL